MSRPVPPPKPSELKNTDPAAKPGEVKKLNLAILGKFETQEPEGPGKGLSNDAQQNPEENSRKPRRTTWNPSPRRDVVVPLGMTKRRVSDESMLSRKIHVFEQQGDATCSVKNESSFQSKLQAFQQPEQVKQTEALAGPKLHALTEETGHKKCQKPDRPPPPPPSKQSSKPMTFDELATIHSNSSVQNTTDPFQRSVKPVAAPRRSLMMNRDGGATESQQKFDKPVAPPPKPKRTFEHDIYMETKAAVGNQKAADSTKNAISGKIQGFEKSAAKPAPPRPPPPLSAWRASHPPSPMQRQMSSPIWMRSSTLASDRSSASDYEYVSDWINGRQYPSSPEKRGFRQRSLSSEDLSTLTRPKTIATGAPSYFEEPIYAEPSIAMGYRMSSSPEEHVYSEPYEQHQIAADIRDEFQRRRVQTMKPTGSVKFHSELQRRSSSLDGQNNPASTNHDMMEDDSDKKKLPWIQRKINDAFMVFKLKKTKKDKGSTDAAGMAESMSQESADSDNETEMSEADHRRRLRHVKSVKETAVYCTLDKIRAGMRYQQIFDCIVRVELQKKQTTGLYEPVIKQQHPKEVSGTSKERLPAIPQFCFPDAANWAPIHSDRVETFSFVLTSLDGSRTYGYCRRLMPMGTGLRLPVVYCILSPVGCFNLYDQILDEVEKRMKISQQSVDEFLKAVSSRTMPRPGKTIKVDVSPADENSSDVVLERSMDSRLEHVDFGCILQFLSVKKVIEIFASIILERRIIFTAKKLSTLSGCIHAFAAMLYPFTWQHAYIPVLPIHLIEMCCLPTPYMIGLLSICIPQLDDLELDEALVVNLDDQSFVRAVGDEHTILPKKVQMALEKALTGVYRDNHEHKNEDDYDADEMVSETFVRLFVEMVGHYSKHMKQFPNGSIHFQREAFQKAHPSKSIRKFLEIFMETQMFSVFIQEKEIERMKISTQGTFDKRVQEYAEVSSVMQSSNPLAKLGIKVKALGNRVVEAANAKLKK
ncbi:DENN domain-containing protein 2B-like [Ptychodera flava]|uniref:DENN domain-containing protein 2B-like n=1 Tax=Ptychodera flava TaxID=63121 RepID=UPI00396A0148